MTACAPQSAHTWLAMGWMRPALIALATFWLKRVMKALRLYLHCSQRIENVRSAVNGLPQSWHGFFDGFIARVAGAAEEKGRLGKRGA